MPHLECRVLQKIVPMRRKQHSSIQARGQNQIIDDRTQKVLRSDSKAKDHTEYRVYYRKHQKWLLAAIKRPADVQHLIAKDNFDTVITPEMMKWIYQKGWTKNKCKN